MKSDDNTVYFVGAGPGDPDLITVKGRRLLDEADLVIYTGSLVPQAVLHGIHARKVDSSSMTLDEVITAISQAWRNGKKVVRLHTGDPSIYGAIREQLARLYSLGIPCRVIPGVSSVMATAAALSAEFTLPDVSQTVIITRMAGRTPVPEKEALRSLASHQASMVVLLSVAMIEKVVEELLAGGYPAQTPAAVVEKASWPEQRIIRGTLDDIADRTLRAGVSRTAIIAVGRAIGEAPDFSLSRLYDSSFSHGYRQAEEDA